MALIGLASESIKGKRRYFVDDTCDDIDASKNAL